ncbi:MAG: IS630 family transposase [Tepidisphaeraceae bacterium]|jgi:transposase
MKAYSEDLRVRVIYDSDSGMPTKAVAGKYRVSRAWVHRLKQRRRETGSISPKQRAKSATLKRFPVDRLSELEAFLREGAIAHGWINELWTIQRVGELIKSKFQLDLSHTTVWRILKTDLGWSSIKPQTVLRERDEEKISKWREQDFDEIRRRAQKRGAYLVFVDEAGFMLQPTLRKTFAPRGSRPVTRVSDPHGRISTVCAMAVSPKRKRLNLYFRLLPDNTNFTGHSIASFLKYVHQELRSPITVIWDSIPIHSADPVRRYLRSQREVVLEMIPEYAPELNPADGVWSYIKYGRLANFAPHDLSTLRKQVTKELKELCDKPQHLASFIAKCKLSLDDW